MNDKKKQETEIIEDFQKVVKYKFKILTTQESKSIFHEYNGENPDFVVRNDQSEYIGIELFRLSPKPRKNSIRGPDGSSYKNLEHLIGKNKEKFNTNIKDFEENSETILSYQKYYKNPEICSTLKQNLESKNNKPYVTKKLWILAYSSESNHSSVSDVYDDKNMEEIRKQIDSYFSKFDKIFSFETRQENDVYYLLEMNSKECIWHCSKK